MFSRALGTLSPRGFVNAAVTWTLILAFAFASTVARAAGTDLTFGALSITSDPPGATVYVDGAAVGQTPLIVDQLPAGDHRVKVVKTGYLENGRVVTVASGQSKNLNVKLTAGTSSGSASSVAARGGSIFSNKWFLLGTAAAIGTTVYLVTKESNKAPNAGTPTASPSTALQGALVSFNAAGASDPDGDSLSYSWAFGDGGTGTGASVTHAYTSAGNFTAVLTVSDGKKSSTASVAVTIRSLSGIWRGPLVGGSGTFNTNVTLSQSGANLTGTYTDQFGAGTVSGTVGTNGSITFTVTIPGFVPFTFTGTADGAVNVLTGVANGSGFENASWVLTRG